MSHTTSHGNQKKSNRGRTDLDYFWNEMKENIYNEILMKIARNREIQQYFISINERTVKRL
jgi:hypothetical protein